MATDGPALLDGNDFLWKYNQRLLEDNQALRREVGNLRLHYTLATAEVQRTRDELHRTQEQNTLLKQRVADLTAEVKHKSVPAFVKPNVPRKRKRRPGRPPGHEPALRPMPDHIDTHQQVPLPVDDQGQACCPRCNAPLSDVENLQRIYEDLVIVQPLVTCYHTARGYCPRCRDYVESRAPDQPPAADVSHGQLGLNSLATVVLLRVKYRLPVAQISDLFTQVFGLHNCPGAICKQVQRVARWWEKAYEHLKLKFRTADVVYADETGWRTDGRNGYLWTLANDRQTLFHVDRSRSGQVIADLLGEGFGAGDGTLVSDFYSAYNCMGGSKQKCNTHLLRELREVVARRPELKDHPFFRRCKRLIKHMLRLKKRRLEMVPQEYEHQVQLAEKRLEELSQQTWNDPDADRLTARLAKYRRELTTFLHRPEVDGTNNAAERALRPAVVMRKITGGSRSAKGARAWAVLASILRTAEQQDRPLLETIKTLMRMQWAGLDPTLLTDAAPAGP